MSILDSLSSALGQRDEQANIAVADRVAASGDSAAVAELVGGLSAKSAAVRSDCIKALYEIGERSAGLIAPHADAFRGLLTSRDNRLQWGAMTALHAIARHDPDRIAPMLADVSAAAEAGSVITRDHAVGVMIALCGSPRHREPSLPSLLAMLQTAPENQFPMYAENALETLAAADPSGFRAILEERVDLLPKASQQARVKKVMKRLEKLAVSRG